MPYVTERWLGGTLTNFRTIRSRLQRLEELENTLDSEQALSYSKKMISTLNRERRKIERNLSGIRHMNRLPEALLVVDPRREHIAVAEARKLGIKVVALLDTDCDPDMIDLPIPGNDDSMRSIELLISQLTDRDHRGTGPPPPPNRRRLPTQGKDAANATGAADRLAARARASAAWSSSATAEPRPTRMCLKPCRRERKWRPSRPAPPPRPASRHPPRDNEPNCRSHADGRDHGSGCQ